MERAKLSPRKLPTQARSRATVDAILQATTYILHRQSFEGLNTNAVARRAGVNIATLYQYFPNKEALVAELARRHVVRTRAAALKVLQEAGHGRNVAATIGVAVDALLASHRIEPELHRILTLQPRLYGQKRIATESDDALKALGTLWLKRSAERFERPELTLWVAFTAIHTVLHAALVERPGAIDDPAFAAELRQLALRYLRA
ncbi:MAG: TetR/AcrR family transcriptional regulator [Myxococcales bacterium]